MELQDQSQDLMEGHRETRPQRRSLIKKMRSNLSSGKFRPGLLQGVVLGCVVGLSVNEVTVHLLAKMSVDAGELPSYVNHTLFLSLSLLEALVSPFVCWLGYKNTRFTMMGWIALSIATTLPMFFLSFDTASESTALCTAMNTPRASSNGGAKPIIRLVALVLMGVSSALARMSVFAHGVSVLDNHVPEVLMKEFGIFIAARAIVLTVGKTMILDLLVSKTWAQLLTVVLPLVVKCVLLGFVGEPDDEDVGVRRDFVSTLKRVLNPPVLIHAVCLGFLTAGLWGFSLYNTAVMEAKYHVVLLPTAAGNVAVMLKLQYALVALVVVVTYQYSPSLLKSFNRQGAKKQALLMSLVIVVLMTVTAMLRCDEKAKNWDEIYEQPSCSLNCGCSSDLSRLNFNPVCSLDTMTTFFSPCHAGCRNQTVVNGVTVLKQCLCSPRLGDSVMGACTTSECSGVRALHETLVLAVLLLAVSSILLHCMAIVRSVSNTDKSTAIGVIFSVTAILAFLGGHALFMMISDWTCAYKQNGECQLQNASFGKLVGIISASLVAISSVINIVTTIILRLKS